MRLVFSSIPPRSCMRLSCILIVVAVAVGGAMPAAAQSTSPARPRFDRFDVNGDGALRDGEVARCGCHSQDADADGEVTFEEFQRPAPPVVSSYRLVEVAGHPLPAPDATGAGLEISAGRLTLYSTGIVALRMTAREMGGPDTTVTRIGRYQQSGEALTVQLMGDESSATVSGGGFRIKFASDAPWMLWRRTSAAAPARPPRR
ncbi:MAG TPA: hypothetical protein VFS20_17805 [Longimicrobium sp.]|nr:hypothetical protein [Longimicrobium sp.]